MSDQQAERRKDTSLGELLAAEETARAAYFSAAAVGIEGTQLGDREVIDLTLAAQDSTRRIWVIALRILAGGLEESESEIHCVSASTSSAAEQLVAQITEVSAAGDRLQESAQVLRRWCGRTGISTGR